MIGWQNNDRHKRKYGVWIAAQKGNTDIEKIQPLSRQEIKINKKP